MWYLYLNLPLCSSLLCPLPSDPCVLVIIIIRRVLHAIAVPARVTLRPSLVEFRERVVFRREMISGSVCVCVCVGGNMARFLWG